MEITRAGIMINQPSNSMSNNIGVFHTPNESASPPVAFVSASGLVITGSTLSAYSPPRALYFPTAITNYRAYPFPTNINSSPSYIFISVALPGTYIQGSFNKVTQSDGNELPALSSAYFVW